MIRTTYSFLVASLLTTLVQAGEPGQLCYTKQDTQKEECQASSGAAANSLINLDYRTFRISILFNSELGMVANVQQSAAAVRSKTGELALENAGDRKSEYQIYRSIFIPIKFENSEYFGFDFSKQVRGYGSDDKETGQLSFNSGSPVSPLFGHFRGVYVNAGLAVMGGGYRHAVNSNGTTLSGINFSMLSPPEVSGVNIGASIADFNFTILPSLDQAQATHSIYPESNIPALPLYNVKWFLTSKDLMALRLVKSRAN